jgi:CBS-domain-containing membrane protein
MRAADVMSRPVLTVRADDTVEQAAALLSHKNVTAAPVLDSEGDLIGIVSEGDLLRARVASERDGAQTATAVADVMSRTVIVLPPDAALSEVAEAMLRHNVHSVPIVDDGAELAGIVCRHDLLRAYVRTDDTVQWDVQHRLDQYAGEQRKWTATVARGVVEVEGSYVDDVERRVVEALARTVGGVSQVKRRVARLEL